MAIKVRKSNQWVSVSGGGGESIGVILAWGGPSGSIPIGYLLCDGSAISRTTYSDLFSTIGVTHGIGDGSNTFNLPNLKDKFVVGATNSTGDTTYPGVSPGSTGGQANAIVPNHTHPTTVDGTKLFPAAGGTTFSYGGSGTYPGTVFTMSNPSNGEDVTNKNLPPYYALCYIIKVFNTRADITNSPANTVTVQNSGSQVSSTAGVINFSTGLTASGSGSNVTVTSSGGTAVNSTKIVTFTSNDTYTPTSGTKSITVYCIAGGGGSSFVSGNTDSEGGDVYARSGGGGGGGACIGYYNLTGSFSATITVGPGGTGGTNSGSESGGSGGESKFTPSGNSTYSGDGALDADGGGGVGSNGVSGAGGGSATGGSIQMPGDRGEYRGSFYPGKGGRAGYVFGNHGKGAMGTGPSVQGQNGNAGGAGIIVIYEYIS